MTDAGWLSDILSDLHDLTEPLSTTCHDFRCAVMISSLLLLMAAAIAILDMALKSKNSATAKIFTISAVLVLVCVFVECQIICGELNKSVVVECKPTTGWEKLVSFTPFVLYGFVIVVVCIELFRTMSSGGEK